MSSRTHVAPLVPTIKQTSCAPTPRDVALRRGTGRTGEHDGRAGATIDGNAVKRTGRCRKVQSSSAMWARSKTPRTCDGVVPHFANRGFSAAVAFEVASEGGGVGDGNGEGDS